MLSKYDKFKAVKAEGFVLWLLNKFNFTAWTSAWGKIYVRPDQVDNQNLINHEQVHAMQIQRDGWFIQPLKYTWYLIKYGYKDNPYEVEARKLSGV